MLRVLSGLMEATGKTWCKVAHPDPMWPVKGKYICPTCQRSYPVLWETAEVPTHNANRAEVVPIRAAGEHVAA